MPKAKSTIKVGAISTQGKAAGLPGPSRDSSRRTFPRSAGCATIMPANALLSVIRFFLLSAGQFPVVRRSGRRGRRPDRHHTAVLLLPLGRQAVVVGHVAPVLRGQIRATRDVVAR